MTTCAVIQDLNRKEIEEHQASFNQDACEAEIQEKIQLDIDDDFDVWSIPSKAALNDVEDDLHAMLNEDFKPLNAMTEDELRHAASYALEIQKKWIERVEQIRRAEDI